jgi:AhpD family alkylhydroperoxidase
MKNPVMILPLAMQALQAFSKASENAALPSVTIDLVQLRASQINGCSVCVDMPWRMMKKEGETDKRLFAVAAWREAPYFTDAERTALALTETLTRLADRPDWEEATRHYDERALAALLLAIATINVWNRLNAATRQVAGEWIHSAEAKKWLESSAASRESTRAAAVVIVCRHDDRPVRRHKSEKNSVRPFQLNRKKSRS